MALRHRILTALLLSLVPLSARAGGGLDVEKWLARPGVRLLAVEFYATWCKPCMAAVPRWKKLHDRYRDQGLRLVVVATRDPRGQCVNPGWNPDDVICDVEGRLADAMRVGDALPAAFLWSWRGRMLVRRGHVTEVEKAVKSELAAMPRVAMEPASGPDARTIKGLQKLLRGELAKRRKVEVVAGREERKALAAVRKSSRDLRYSQTSRCRIGEELAANSLLRVSLVKMGRSKRLMLGLLSAEKGCLTASSSVPWSERHPDTSVAEAVAELMENLKVPLEMPGAPPTPSRAAPKEGSFGGGEQGWDPSAPGGKRVLVSFASEPPGAVVMVDGQLLCTTTPCKEEVTAGVHAVSMQKKRHEPRRERVELEADGSVSWRLKANFAVLEIQSRPDGVKVQVDGREVGVTPIEGLEVSPGRREIKIADRCYALGGERVVVKAGDRRRVMLKPRAVPSAIDVSARVKGVGAVKAEVWVDGGHVGTTPGVLKVPVCSRTIEVRHRDHGSWRGPLSLRPKQVARVRAELRSGGEGAAPGRGKAWEGAGSEASPARGRQPAPRRAPRTRGSSGGFLSGLFGGDPVEKDAYAGVRGDEGKGSFGDAIGGILFGKRGGRSRRALTDRDALQMLDRGTVAERREALPFLFHRQRVDRTVLAAIDLCGRRLVHECVPALVQSLQHETPRVRHGAAGALATMKEPSALEPLARRATADPADRLVMVRAGETIAATLSDKRLRRMTRSNNPALVEMATRVMARKRGGTPVEVAAALLRDGNPQMRLQAVRQLAGTPAGHRKANQGLVMLARDRDPRVSSAAAASLGQRRVARALPLLIELTRHPHASVRRAAFGALVNMRGQLKRRRRARLFKRCVKDRDAGVRQVCLSAR